MTYQKNIQMKLILLLVLVLGATAEIFAADGDLDSSFDGDGVRVIDNNSGEEFFYDVLVLPDGKIVAVSSFIAPAPAGLQTLVSRYNSDGSFDSTFGTGGKAVIPAVAGRSLALQSDGKIVVGGSETFGLVGGEIPVSDFMVVRLNTNGTLDTTFNGTGKALIDIRGTNDIGSSVKVQADGKILIGGSSARNIDRSDFAIARLNPNGTFDTKFIGVATTQGQFVSFGKLAIQPDGKILATGRGPYYVPPVEAPAGFSAITFRFNADGTPDASFDGDGMVETRDSSGNAIAVQPDGKIIVVGNVSVRYNADGTLDPTFGTNGRAAVGGADVKLQADNKIVLAYGGGVARLNTNGALDLTFSGDGINAPTVSAEIRAVAIQPDGKIVAGGHFGSSNSRDLVLARFIASVCTVNCIGRTAFDFDGDSRADISVFNPSVKRWDILRSATQDWLAVLFGNATDRITPADYDNDGKTDVAVYRDGNWYMLRSTAGYTGVQFGTSEDIPRPADFDGDGQAELAVFRPSNGAWYVLNLANGQFSAVQFGASGDKPVAADFDGDNRADYAVFRPTDGVWYQLRSQAGFAAVQFGIATDKPVAADYDGDRKTDIAVYRDGVWYQLRSATGFAGFQFGTATDVPAPADFDGDGKADLAVYRSGTWHIQQSTSGLFTRTFGQPNDKPIPSAYIP